VDFIPLLKFKQMDNLIITTPEQLSSLISETVRAEFAKQGEQSVASQINKETELLTRKEAALLLGISLPTLHDWSKNGVITAYRIGTRVRYKRVELEQSLTLMNTEKNSTRKK
jgi:excisionase family DNA binding protein